MWKLAINAIKLTIFWVVCLLITGKTVATQLPNNQPCQLIYGWDEVKPYQYFNQDKQVIGFQIDLVKAIAQQMGCELTLHHAIWDDLVQAVKTGKVDFIADITITEERAKYGYFSDAYRKETYTLYVRADEIKKYRGKSLAEMVNEGFKLGLTKGYLYSQELETYRKSSRFQRQFIEQDKNITNYQLLINNEIDGLLEDSMVAGFTLRNNEISRLIKALPLEVHRGDVSFWLSKKRLNSEILERFNRALKAVKQSSEYQKYWLKDIK